MVYTHSNENPMKIIIVIYYTDIEPSRERRIEKSKYSIFIHQTFGLLLIPIAICILFSIPVETYPVSIYISSSIALLNTSDQYAIIHCQYPPLSHQITINMNNILSFHMTTYAVIHYFRSYCL